MSVTKDAWGMLLNSKRCCTRMADDKSVMEPCRRSRSVTRHQFYCTHSALPPQHLWITQLNGAQQARAPWHQSPTSTFPRIVRTTLFS